MHRTRNRPLPTGRITTSEALTFAAVSGTTSIGVLYCAFGGPTAALALGTIGMYAGVYTPMKRITPYNTHVGAVAGALPVLMGYTAAGCSLLTAPPWALFAFQTLWQFPHFYVLAWLHREDYARGGFQMFPMHMTGEQTAELIKPYFAALAALPLATYAAGATAPMFVVDMWVLTALFYRSFHRFEQKPTNASARALFLWSLWYLFGGFGALILHSSLQEHRDWRERLRLRLGEFCVHESLKDDIAVPSELCWIPSMSCPAGKREES